MSRVLQRARAAVRASDGSIAAGPPRTVSTCARALLAWHGIDPLDAAQRVTDATGHASITIAEIRQANGHLAMTITLPMPYGDARMKVRTGDGASITFPGMTLSPAMTAATIGRPIGRLAGHPAFDALDFLRVTAVRQGKQAGHPATILSFDDTADAITGPHEATETVQ